MRKTLNFLAPVLSSLICFFPVASQANQFEHIKNQVVEHQLDNGMRFLILERHDAPLVSLVVAVKAGSVNEQTNKTGIAHFLEHLAFKGTQSIGTTNYRLERKALDEMDKAFTVFRQACVEQSDSQLIYRLYNDFQKKQNEAKKYVVPTEFAKIYELNGAVGLNATTDYDFTTFINTLPSNRLELWCAMESDRLNKPVYREFYQERDVIMEERRLRIDNSPQGLLYEELTSASYKAHPYGQPVVGHSSDIENLTRQDVEDFRETYYVPQNITAAIVGDIDPQEVIHLVSTYFSRIPERPDPPPVVTTEPRQPGIRRTEIRAGDRPMVMVSFLTVPEDHQDALSLSLLSTILTESRLSRLYKSLVEKKQMASFVSGLHSTGLYGGVFVIQAGALPGVTASRLEAAIVDELESLKNNPVTEEELDAARARWELKYYKYYASDLGICYGLALADLSPGGWEKLFQTLQEAGEITSTRIMDVTDRYLDINHRTVAILEAVDE